MIDVFFPPIFPVHLPWETIARPRGVSTVAIIVNGPDASGAFRPEVVPGNVVLQNLLPKASMAHLSSKVFAHWYPC